MPNDRNRILYSVLPAETAAWLRDRAAGEGDDRTMYGTLSKMEGDGLIRFDHEEEKRKLYCITPLGEEVLETERKRIRRLYQNSQGEDYHE